MNAAIATANGYRAMLRHAESALIDERRLLTVAELSDLAAIGDDGVPALASLAHEVRLAWCGPTVEVEGILSAKTGGCPEDCHFCSQSSQFEETMPATPFLDTEEVLIVSPRDGDGRSVGILHRSRGARARRAHHETDPGARSTDPGRDGPQRGCVGRDP